LEEGIIKLDSPLNVCIMFILQCVWLFCGFVMVVGLVWGNWLFN